MITKIIYARLYNLGNYENERLEVEVTAPDGVSTAEVWEAAVQAVEDQHLALEAARAEARQREREEYERRRQGAINARKAATPNEASDDLDF